MEKRIVKVVCEEGICPLCGGELEYGLRDDTDEGGIQEWTCSECGATGNEGFDRVFDGNHYNVQDIDGNQVEIESPTQEPKRWLAEEPGYNTCPVCGKDVAEYDDAGKRQDFPFCPYCTTKLEEVI